MIQLEGVLLFALDVVKGPYVHCSAPYNPFVGRNEDGHAASSQHQVQPLSLSTRLLSKRSAENGSPANNTSTSSIRIFQDDDTDAWSEGNIAMEPTQGGNSEALFSTAAISTEATNGATTVATATTGSSIGGLIDLFVPRSEFCHRVLWLHPAESGFLYLYYPEEIPGEHYQRKTLRYSLCFMFQVDPSWMSIGESHIQQLVKPYSMMLRNVAEKLRYAEVKYGYISRALTASNVFPSGHFSDAHTATVPPILVMTTSNAPSNSINEDENYAPSSSECRNTPSIATTKLASAGTSLSITNTQHANTTRNQFLSFSSLTCPCEEGMLPSQPVDTLEETASYVVCGKGEVVSAGTEPTASQAEFSESSTVEKPCVPFRMNPEEATGAHADGSPLEGSKKGSEGGDEAATKTTAAGAGQQNNHEDSLPNLSRFQTVASSSSLSTGYIPPDMLYRQLDTSGASTSAFSSTAAAFYPMTNHFITPLVEHRWTPLGEFIEGLYHVLRKADLDEGVVEEPSFMATGTLEVSGGKPDVGVSLDRIHAWALPNTDPPLSTPFPSKVVVRVAAASPHKMGYCDYEAQCMGAGGGEAGRFEEQPDDAVAKVSGDAAPMAFTDKKARRIERRAAALAARLREEKVYDPKSVYLSNNLDIRISRIAPLRVAETIRLNQVPIPIVSYSVDKMEVFERMDLIVYEALKLVDGCRTVAAIAFILSMKLSAQLREFYSTTVQSVASSVARVTTTSSSQKHTTQREQPKKKSGAQGTVASGTSPYSTFDASLPRSGHAAKGSFHNFSPHVLVSVFHYAPTKESSAPASLSSSSIPPSLSNKNKARTNSPLHSFAHSQNVTSAAGQRHPPDMLLNVLERGTSNVLNPNMSMPSFVTNETSMALELPACWKVVLDVLVEALLHLQMCNFVRLLDVWSPHMCYQTTERFYEILTNYKHPAREAIGSYMLQVTDQVHLAPRKASRASGVQKSGDKHQRKDRFNRKDKTEHTDTSEGLPSQSKSHRTGTGKNPPQMSSYGLNVELHCDDPHDARVPQNVAETVTQLKSRESLLSTTTTSSLISKKWQDKEIGKRALRSATPLDNDGSSELLRLNSASTATAVGASASSETALHSTSPPSLIRQHSQKTERLTTVRHTSRADTRVLTPTTAPSIANNRHGKLRPRGQAGLTPEAAMGPTILPVSPFMQCASIHTPKGTAVDPSSLSHSLPEANIALNLGIGVGMEVKSNRWYLTLSAAPLSAHSILSPFASIPLSVPSAPEEETTPTVRYAVPASWSSHEGKFSEFIITKSGKGGRVGGSGKEPTIGDGTNSSDGLISSTTSSELCSDISSLSSSTIVSLQVPDTVVPTSSDGTNFMLAEAAVHSLHKKSSCHLEVPKSCSPSVVTPCLGRYTILHTEAEISLAASAALCALGKFQRNTVEAVQLEMRWLPAWAGAFAGWATPCCWALVELATLNGWLEKVSV